MANNPAGSQPGDAADTLSFRAGIVIARDDGAGSLRHFRPVLLLPEGIEDDLTPEQLEAVLAHELRHIRYRDNLTAALHMCVETLFWFHPLVWWIGAKLMEERERDCDEAVLLQGNQPGDYARGIVKVCETYMESPLPCASGISGSNLKKRIRGIMMWRGSLPMTFRARAALAIAGFVVVSAPFLIGIVDAQSRAANTVQNEFDAVSIKPYLPQGPTWEACNPRIDPIRLSLTGCTLKNLVRLAYDLKGYQIPAQGPEWTSTDRYVVEARSTTPATRQELMRMLQPMLAARFGLKVHWEVRQGPVYFLNVASHGLKLPPASRKDHCGEVNIRPNSFWSDCDSMDDFAEDLQELVLVRDRPVINRTQLTKEQYEIKLDFSLDDDPAVGPSLFSALPAQLGLTLTSGKAPVRKLALDHVQRPQPD